MRERFGAGLMQRRLRWGRIWSTRPAGRDQGWCNVAGAAPQTALLVGFWRIRRQKPIKKDRSGVALPPPTPRRRRRCNRPAGRDDDFGTPDVTNAIITLPQKTFMRGAHTAAMKMAADARLSAIGYWLSAIFTSARRGAESPDSGLRRPPTRPDPDRVGGLYRS